ncbi:hypothetical protein C5688_09115 [Methylocystis sp. MitZ-2018]|nr:hypothetical protein C5688_09115 [Methylocystis sp. MitZ-2018]
MPRRAEDARRAFRCGGLCKTDAPIMRPPRGYQPQVALGELVEVDDDGKQQTVTHHGFAGEKHSEVYRPQPFGFSSHPPKGSTGIIVSLGGERNRSVFLGGEHDDHRPTKLKEGQVKNYDKAGNSIGLLADDGVATAVTKGNHTTSVEKGSLSVDVKDKDISFKAKKDSSLEVSEGKLTVKAKAGVEIKDDLTVAGVLKIGSAFIAGGGVGGLGGSGGGAGGEGGGGSGGGGSGSGAADTLIAGNAIYRFKICYPGIPGENSLLAGEVFTSGVAPFVGWAGSAFRCTTPPVDDYALSLRKNGTEVATIVFPAGETSAVISGETINFADGDMLTLFSPPALDVISGIFGTIEGLRG